LGKLFGAEQIREIPLWVGRDALLTELRGELWVGCKVIVLVGQGGIGKTSLAVKLLESIGVEACGHRLSVDCLFSRVLYVRVHEGMSFDATVAALVQGLDIALSDGMKSEQMIDTVIGGLQRCRTLVVLDNLENVLSMGKSLSEEWGQLLWALVDRDHFSQVIITSREHPVDLADRGGKPDLTLVKTWLISGISVEDSITLLRQEGVRDEPEDLRWAAERVGGHVQILTFLANIAANEDSGFLRKHPDLVTNRAGPTVNAQLKRQTGEARSLLEKMCILRSEINIKELTFLRLYNCGLFQDVRFLGLKWWKRSIQFNDREIDKTQLIVNNLSCCSLIEVWWNQEKKEKYYSLHNVISESMKMKMKIKGRIPDLMQNAYWLYRDEIEAINPRARELEDLRPLLEVQHFAFEIGSHDEAISLIETLFPYLKRWGYWRLLHDLIEKSLPEATGAKYQFCCQILGKINYDWGDWKRAEEYLNLSRTNAEETNCKSDNIISWNMLCGDIERNRGNWDEAERLYLQYQRMCSESDDQSGVATAKGSLGSIERNRGNWDKAERLYRESLRLNPN
jgi:hypothetical protein